MLRKICLNNYRRACFQKNNHTTLLLALATMVADGQYGVKHHTTRVMLRQRSESRAARAPRTGGWRACAARAVLADLKIPDFAFLKI